MTSGFPAVLLKNEATGRFHPMIYRIAPLPSGEVGPGVHRYKSIGHHTAGFDLREDALATILGEKERGWVWTGRELSWDGSDVPASVAFFAESELSAEKASPDEKPRYFMIDSDQLKALERVQRRLHSERRMDGDEMRDAGHTIEAIVRVARELEVPEASS